MTRTKADALWEIMPKLYGSEWKARYGQHDEGDIWQRMLDRFHAEQIKHAIAMCVRHYRDKPPNLPQFRNLCEQHPNPDEPFQLEHRGVTPAPAGYAADHMKQIGGFVDRKAPAMTEEQREHHLRVLGIDDETLARKAKPWVKPGSNAACRYPGCTSPGTFSGMGANAHRYCWKHFRQ